MVIDRSAFFKALRAEFGSLKQPQVDGINTIVDLGLGGDTRHLAYMLATAWHETDKQMQPIREYGLGKRKKYGTTYYGRGYVQLTWLANYKKAGKKLGVDLVGNPDKALDPFIAAEVMMVGMREGWFTGKKLSDYFNDKADDPEGARKIINGTDRAKLIAGYHQKFRGALTAAVVRAA